MADIEEKDQAVAAAARLTEYDPDGIADPTAYGRGVAVVTTFELWSYYIYYNGDSGGGPNGGFAGLVDKMVNNNAQKNFLAYNATLANPFPSGASCGPSTSTCMVGSGSTLMPQVSFVLVRTGLAQLLVAIVLIVLGGLGDYKLYGRTFLVWSTIACIILHFAFAAVNIDTTPWYIPSIMLVFTLATYNMTLAFFFAAFPRLANHMPSVYQKIDDGCTVKEVDGEIALQRSRISIISTYWSHIGWAIPLLIYTGIIFMLNPNPDAGQTNWTYNASAIMYGIYWLISALPYFFLDKKRPGPDIPIGANVYMEGLVQAKEALQLAKKLPQAWLYIIGFFLYCDGINSCGTLIGNLQAQYLSYNVLSSNLFALAQAVSGMIGCLAFWWIQLYFKLETKTMLQFSNFLTLLMYAWALVGLVSPSMGYKSSGEFWFYNIGYGIWTSPFWALQNTYLSDLIPNRKAYLFFSLFGIMNKASAFIGPIVNFFITVVAKGNSDYIAFIPCTILALVGFIMIQYTNPATARLDILAFEEAEREFEGERLSRIKPKVGKVGTISH